MIVSEYIYQTHHNKRLGKQRYVLYIFEGMKFTMSDYRTIPHGALNYTSFAFAPQFPMLDMIRIVNL